MDDEAIRIRIQSICADLADWAEANEKQINMELVTAIGTEHPLYKKGYADACRNAIGKIYINIGKEVGAVSARRE